MCVTVSGTRNWELCVSSAESNGYHDGKKTGNKMQKNAVFFHFGLLAGTNYNRFFLAAYDTDYGDCSIGQPLC